MSVKRALECSLISLKNSRFVPNTANTDVNKKRRKNFVEQLLDLASSQRPIIYVDETNFNLFIARTQGRAPIGQRTNVIRPSARGRNIHLIGAIGSNGFSFFECRRGSFTIHLANEYVRTCLREARQFFAGQPVVMVVDNAPCHNQIESVFEESEFEGNVLLRLGPYSPMLNPIESAWSKIKATAKRLLADQINSILDYNGENGSITEHRLQRLEEIIRNSLLDLTREDILQFIAGVQRFYAGVINLEDVTF